MDHPCMEKNTYLLLEHGQSIKKFTEGRNPQSDPKPTWASWPHKVIDILKSELI